MGGGSFDTNSYRSYTSSVASKPRAAVFTSRAIDPSLDPKGVTVRESCDSADNPQSTPIIIALDVTGSMGEIAEAIAKGGLGKLFQGILDRKPVTDPHLMFMGIGDVTAHDKAPLQVSQFEADNRIVEQLTKMWLEGGGGGNSHESYDLPWYFAARHTVHDAMRLRGKRGYLFTVGDEEAPERLTRDEIKTVMGNAPQADILSRDSLREAQRLYDVFHVVIEQGDYARTRPDRVRRSWNETLGQHVLYLKEHELLAETVVAAIQVAEGADHKTAAGGWGAVAGGVIGDAIHTLPRGVPAPRMLGA